MDHSNWTFYALRNLLIRRLDQLAELTRQDHSAPFSSYGQVGLFWPLSPILMSPKILQKCWDFRSHLAAHQGILSLASGSYLFPRNQYPQDHRRCPLPLFQLCCLFLFQFWQRIPLCVGPNSHARILYCLGLFRFHRGWTGLGAERKRWYWHRLSPELMLSIAIEPLLPLAWMIVELAPLCFLHQKTKYLPILSSLVSVPLLLPPWSCFPMQLRFHRHLWCQLSCLHLPSYKLHWVHLSPSSFYLPCLLQKAYSGGFQALSVHLCSSKWGTRA